MYGENFGTGTLTDMLAHKAERIRKRCDDGEPTDDDMVDDCRNLMEGATVLYHTLMHERDDDRPRYCHTKMTCMYVGTPNERRIILTCAHKDETYGMRWMPRHCPICGGELIVTGGGCDGAEADRPEHQGRDGRARHDPE